MARLLPPHIFSVFKSLKEFLGPEKGYDEVREEEQNSKKAQNSFLKVGYFQEWSSLEFALSIPLLKPKNRKRFAIQRF